MTDTKNAPATPQPFGAGPGGHPSYRANLERQPYADDCCSCAYCGKAVKAARFYAYTYWGGTFDRFDATSPEAHHSNVGWLKLGSDCARVLRKAGIEVVPAKRAIFPF